MAFLMNPCQRCAEKNARRSFHFRRVMLIWQRNLDLKAWEAFFKDNPDLKTLLNPGLAIELIYLVIMDHWQMLVLDKHLRMLLTMKEI